MARGSTRTLCSTLTLMVSPEVETGLGCSAGEVEGQGRASLHKSKPPPLQFLWPACTWEPPCRGLWLPRMLPAPPLPFVGNPGLLSPCAAELATNSVLLGLCGTSHSRAHQVHVALETSVELCALPSLPLPSLCPVALARGCQVQGDRSPPLLSGSQNVHRQQLQLHYGHEGMGQVGNWLLAVVGLSLFNTPLPTCRD